MNEDEIQITEENEAESHPVESEQQNDEAEGAELEIVIEGAEPDESEKESNAAPAWVKEMRKASREKDKRIRELEKLIEKKPEALPKKPTLADCDYDEEAFEESLTAWHSKKAAVDAEERKKEESIKSQQQIYQERLGSYRESKKALRFADVDDAEDAARSSLSETQQAIIIRHASAPAQLIYAIGKNESVARELSKVTDPIEFALKMKDIENRMKTVTKRPPPPEKTVKGASGATGTDATLERLQAEAERTGDRSKVIRYIRDSRRG